MKKQYEKQVPLRVVLIVVCLLVMSSLGFGRIKVNGSPIAFVSTLLKGSSMNQFVVEGASYFFKSHSSYLDLLQKIEISELEYVSLGILSVTVDIAISQMEDTIVAYEKLKKWADMTPYDEEVIGLLKDFNYQKFLRENSLNQTIFWRARNYLRNGDVCGIYDKMLLDSKNILKLLGGISSDLSLGKVPDNRCLWNLNQVYLESMIFDQYVAMVFYAIM